MRTLVKRGNTVENRNIEALRHSASHVMAQAVKELFPEAKLGIGPAIEDGFYYDFSVKKPFAPLDLQKIEKRMKKIIGKNLPFERKIIPLEQARKLFEDRGEEFKLELLEEIKDEEISIYSHGGFIDLCKGPHIEKTGGIKAFKLTGASNAYWKGDEKGEPLQRIYGTAFFDSASLEDYLDRIAKAKENDHRKLGAELDLFSMHEEAGAGLIYWHPKGAMLRKTIEDFWKDEHIRRGYELVSIPHIASGRLWKISGHYDYYRENMYFVKDSGEDYVLKPMNCPGHILIYKTRKRSYRELPVRYAELGTVYRQERSGVLHGMFRVRGFTQDDAHIFCTKEQAGGEILKVLELAKYMLQSFGFDDYELELSVRGKDAAKYAGGDAEWNMAESSLSTAVSEAGLSAKRVEGEAVFYGPKIDFRLKGAVGSWQGPTVQFDFNLPERFGVQYVGSDGNMHNTVMIHRTVLGSMERFVGVVIEKYGGRFPLWLSPVQVKVLTVSEKTSDYAGRVCLRLKNQGIRVELDSRSEKIGLKVRESEMEKVPYLVILGNREAEQGTLSIRKTASGERAEVEIESFVKRLNREIEHKGFKP
jgi:threonyl-tRNA synthetase